MKLKYIRSHYQRLEPCNSMTLTDDQTKALWFLSHISVLLEGTNHQSDELKKPNLKTVSYTDWRNLYAAQSAGMRFPPGWWIPSWQWTDERAQRWLCFDFVKVRMHDELLLCTSLCEIYCDLLLQSANQACYCRTKQYIKWVTQNVVLPFFLN